MTFIPSRLALLIMFTCVASARADASLNATRSTLEKWVETRHLISKTRSDWQADKELLEQTILALERELQSVEDQFGKLGTNSAQVERERAQAETQLKVSNESLDRTRRFAADFEAQIVRLVPRLPAPLQDILKPALSRLPSDPATTRMPAWERTREIVGILGELDKFNNAVTLFSEKRRNAKSEEVAVETVYVGLGAAYFVNDANDFAGTGTPGPNGWEWTVQSELAPAVREVIRIYRNERGAKFVPLPAVIR